MKLQSMFHLITWIDCFFTGRSGQEENNPDIMVSMPMRASNPVTQQALTFFKFISGKCSAKPNSQDVMMRLFRC